MRKFKTTTSFIQSKTSNPSVSDIVEVDGYASVGDGGGAKWQFTGVTGQAPSQSPAQLGDALLNDASGNQWKALGSKVSLKQMGGKFDGTDETVLFIAAKTWSNRTGGVIIVDIGTIKTTPIQVFGIDCHFEGIERESSIIQLVAGTNDHLVATLSNGGVSFKNLTLDQDRLNQTAGHGIRLGGTKFCRINNVTIRNCVGYGIGVQVQTNNGCVWDNFTIENTGVDAIDIKDYNLDNDTIFINNYVAKNYGLISTGQVAIDARGPILVTNAKAEIFGDNFGFRYRGDGVNGRGGFGSMAGLEIVGDGTSTNSQAIKFENEHRKAVFSSVSIRDCATAIIHSTNARGGVISGVCAENIYGTNSMSVLGKGLYMSDVSLQNAAGALFTLDIFPSAENTVIDGFFIDDIKTDTRNSVRVQSGATNTLLRGVLKDSDVNDLGTGTVNQVTIF